MEDPLQALLLHGRTEGILQSRAESRALSGALSDYGTRRLRKHPQHPSSRSSWTRQVGEVIYIEYNQQQGTR